MPQTPTVDKQPTTIELLISGAHIPQYRTIDSAVHTLDTMVHKLKGLGYGVAKSFKEEVDEAGLKIGWRGGEWGIWQREGYVPQLFLQRWGKLPQPSHSAVAFYLMRDGDTGFISYLFMTKPEAVPDLAEIAYNAQIVMTDVLPHVFGEGAARRGLFSSLIRRHNGHAPVGPAHAAEHFRNPASYIFGTEAADKLISEFTVNRYQEALAASYAAYAALEAAGVQTSREDFYAAVTLIEAVGMVEAGQLARLFALASRVPLLKVIEAMKPQAKVLVPQDPGYRRV